MPNPQGLFVNCKGVKIRKGVKVENIGGNYIDRGTTIIDERGHSREDYDQRRAVGVSNGHATLSGSISSGGSGQDPRSRQSARRGTARQEARYQDPAPVGSEDEEGDDTSSDDHQETPSSLGGLFQDSEDIDIMGEVTQSNVAGDVEFSGTKHIFKGNTREAKYWQQGASGVANGDSRLSAAINVGGGGGLCNASRGQQDWGYSDSDDTSGSEASYHTRRHVDRHVDQRHAIAVANGNATFRGNVNINYGAGDNGFLSPPRNQRDGRYSDSGDSSASSPHHHAQHHVDQRHSVGFANDNATFAGDVNVNYGQQTSHSYQAHGRGRSGWSDRYVPPPEERYHGWDHRPPNMHQDYNDRDVPDITFIPSSPPRSYPPDPYGTYDDYGPRSGSPYQTQHGYAGPPGLQPHLGNNQPHYNQGYAHNGQNMGSPASPFGSLGSQSRQPPPRSPSQPPPYVSTPHSHYRNLPGQRGTPYEAMDQVYGGPGMGELTSQMGGMHMGSSSAAYPPPSRSGGCQGKKGYGYCN